MERVDNKQKELIEKIKQFRLLDDDFMSKVFEDDYEYAYGYGRVSSPKNYTLKVRCDHCKSTFPEYETIPVKGIDRGTFFICGDCLTKTNKIEFCASCGEAFELASEEEHKYLCEECDKIFRDRKGKK